MKRHYMGRESVPVTHVYTEEELRGFAQEMAMGLKEAADVEREKKGTNELFKERLAKAEGKAAVAGDRYRDGKETVYVHCNKVADYDTGEILWMDPDSGEIVQRRKMTDEERQVPLICQDAPCEEGEVPPEEDSGEETGSGIPYATAMEEGGQAQAH